MSWPVFVRRGRSSELKGLMPDAYHELRAESRANLENHYRDVQDFEFTIQDHKLYMLQTRNGKRTGPAAVRIAVDMVERGPDLEEKRRCYASIRLKLDQLLHPRCWTLTSLELR